MSFPSFELWLTNRRPFPPWEAGYENDNTIDSSKFWLDSNVKTNLKGYFNGESQQVPRQKKDPLLYAEMLEIHNKYTTPTRLHEVHHTWSTQKKTRPWIRALPGMLRRDATTLPLARSIAASWLPSGSTVVGCTIFQRYWKRLVVVYRLRGSYGSSTRGTTRISMTTATSRGPVTKGREMRKIPRRWPCKRRKTKQVHNIKQDWRLRSCLTPKSEHRAPMQPLLPQARQPLLPQARHHVWGVVELTTNVATARSVGSSKEGSFHLVSGCVFRACRVLCFEFWVLSFEFFVSCFFLYYLHAVNIYSCMYPKIGFLNNAVGAPK